MGNSQNQTPQINFSTWEPQTWEESNSQRASNQAKALPTQFSQDCLLLPITHLFHSASDLLSIPSLLPPALLFLPLLSAFANGPSFAFLELTPALTSPLAFLQVLTSYSKACFASPPTHTCIPSPFPLLPLSFFISSCSCALWSQPFCSANYCPTSSTATQQLPPAALGFAFLLMTAPNDLQDRGHQTPPALHVCKGTELIPLQRCHSLRCSSLREKGTMLAFALKS